MTQTFSPRVVAAVLAVGLLCFVGFALVLAFANVPRADGQAHALSRSAVGFAGVVQLLRDTGAPVRLHREAALPDDGRGLLVLTPTPGHAAPAALPRKTAVLIVLPKWQVEPDNEHQGWVKREGLLRPESVAGLLPKNWPKFAVNRSDGAKITGADAFETAVSSLQTLSGTGVTAIWSDAERGGVVLGKVGRDYVLADPDVLSNQALATPEGAHTAVALLARLQKGPVIFDVSAYDPARGRNPLKMILQPPLLGATLCAVAATILTGLLCARRFGPAQAPTPVTAGPQTLADNAAALIARAGRARRMGGPYAALTRTLAARAVMAPRTLDGPALGAYLDRAGVLRAASDTYTDLADAAGRARSDATMLTAAQRLYRWRMGLIHGHQ